MIFSFFMNILYMYFQNISFGKFFLLQFNFFIFSWTAVIEFMCLLISGVARGVAGVAKATPIFPVLFSKFGKKIWIKKTVFTAGYTNLKILPTSLILDELIRFEKKPTLFLTVPYWLGGFGKLIVNNFNIIMTKTK